MASYEHKKLIERLANLNQVPGDSTIFSQWIQADAHIAFLRDNARADEIVVCASGPYSLVHSVVVPNDRLQPIDRGDLLNWDFREYTLFASYSGRDDLRLERGLKGTGTTTLEDATPLIFARTFEGWESPGRTYYELHQEYAHVSQIHWLPEQRAYCRFNNQGDLEPIVSITTLDDKDDPLTLISFKRGPLEEYLTAANASLVQMFDFTLTHPATFSGWTSAIPNTINDSELLFYRQFVLAGYASYTRGIQIVRPRYFQEQSVKQKPKQEDVQEAREYVTFVAYDRRNKCVTEISTDPQATTNYFEAAGNSLPFEVSPVFFRPDVLLKYKADRDKYTVSERSISCRAAWHLEGIDVNEAGQVHTYIRYLRQLPYEEQLYWRSFNEEPKADISQRAIDHDFEGKWTMFMDPLQTVLSIVRKWHERKISWWTLRDERLFERVSTPLSTSRDEWAEAFMDLAKLVVEGFVTKPLRDRLDTLMVPYDKQQDKTLTLLEKILNSQNNVTGTSQRLGGLRIVQNIRSKTSHASGSDAQQLADDAIINYETYGNHFRFVCTLVAAELERIDQAMS